MATKKVLTETGLSRLVELINSKFAEKTEVPKKTSDITNDSGFITAASPELTGTPTAPTPASNDNSTKIATTEFVKNKLAADFTAFTKAEIYTIFDVPMPVTVTIEQSEHQTIYVTVDETDHTETFTALIGTEYSVTVVPDTGYTAGTVTNVSGTLIEDITISATAAEASISSKTQLNLDHYASNKHLDPYITTLPQENINELTNIAPTESAEHAFDGCSNLTSLSGVEQTWDTANLNYTSYMFYHCQFLTSLDLSNWNTSNMNLMSHMFEYCQSLTSLDLSNWNTSNIGTMKYAFQYCSNLEVLDVSNWDTSNARYMNGMFMGCNKLQYLIIGSSTFKFVMKDAACGGLDTACKILVPNALLNTFKTATNWSNRASQFDAIENYTITHNNGQVTVTPNA